MPPKKHKTLVPCNAPLDRYNYVTKDFILPKKGDHAIKIKNADGGLVDLTKSSSSQPGHEANIPQQVHLLNTTAETAGVSVDRAKKPLQNEENNESNRPLTVPRSLNNNILQNRQVKCPSTQPKQPLTTTLTEKNDLKIENESKNSTENVYSSSSQSPSAEQSSSKTTRSKLNIYARKHVPLWLKLVNESYATEEHSPPLQRINYDTYRATFAGTSILPPPPIVDLPNPGLCDIKHDSLSLTCYKQYWHERLQNEHAAQDIQLSNYALYNADVWTDGSNPLLCRFKIPGLRENTPRIDLGDTIIIRPLALVMQSTIATEANRWSQTRDGIAPGFTGQQHNAIAWSIVRRDEVVIVKLGCALPQNLRCNIIIPIQKHKSAPMWRAVSLIDTALSADTAYTVRNWLQSMLFPDLRDGLIQTSLSKGVFSLQWFDPELNFEQKRAVQAVVDAEYGCVPYLISGPPGTGKSKTIVETALQLLSATKETSPHLLICAPSDAAADTLLVRLSKSLTPKHLFRLNNWTRLVSEVPGEVRPYCFGDSNMLHSLPPFETLMSMKIVVTTCRDANMLIAAGLTNEALATMAMRLMHTIAPRSVDLSNFIHWTALLLDEAAQATEPEALIPLSVVVPANIQTSRATHFLPQFVLAGDEHQLGPLLASKHLATFEIPIKTAGLETSLFQRLFSLEFYASHPLSRTRGAPPLTSSMLPIIRPAFTNLIRNYRSHPAILSTSSQLFYSDTLIPERPDLSAAILSWPLWPSIRQKAVPWPIIFHNNTSADSVESIIAGDGTGAGSLENHNEASIALDFVLSLLNHDNEYSAHFSNSTSTPLRQEDVIVMSPFNAQVRNLRTVFRANELHDVRIGPLEAFQGLESRVVVLCTTRTRLGQSPHAASKFVTEDRSRGLGVIDEPKRFNVALTRAKEALIVIGNAEALTCTRDACWLSFLEFCARNSLFSVETTYWLGKGVYRRGREAGVGRLEKALNYGAELIKRSEEEEEQNRRIHWTEDGNYSSTGRFRLHGTMYDLDEMMRTAGYQQFEDEGQLFEEDEET